MKNYIYREFQNNEDGCIGMDLLKDENGSLVLICKITFWDAVGQFVVDVQAEEIPLDLLEDFILRVKKFVPLE